MENFSLCLPLLSLWIASSTMLGFFRRKTAGGGNPSIRLALAGLLAAGVCLVFVWPSAKGGLSTFHGLLLMDPLGAVVSMAVIFAGIATLGFSSDYFKRIGLDLPEIPMLILLAVSGMMVMVTTDHLPVIFLGLEIMSLSLYILCASIRGREVSIEAGVKYFLAGAFASGLFLMGIAFVYGGTGEMFLSRMGTELAAGNALVLTGSLLLLAGFGFKLAAVPFHQWAPDVYEGAPTPVTGFMSTAVKLVAFTALLRVVAGVGALDERILPVLGWLAVLTMLVGNISALAQKSVKRMLAWSSVSHGGYLLLGVAALSAETTADSGAVSPVEAVIFYLVTYTLMNLGAFGILAIIETREGKGLNFTDLAGLKHRQPVLAAGMLIFMLSLAGLPPTAGFLAKWKLFEALAARVPGTSGGFFVFLITMLIVSSLIGVYYYLRVVVAMYMSESNDAAPAPRKPALLSLGLVLACAGLTLWLGFGMTIFGVGPEGLLTWVHQVAR